MVQASGVHRGLDEGCLGWATEVLVHQVQEELVDAEVGLVGGELRVEGGGEEMVLADEDGGSRRGGARTSTSGPECEILGARMKTISKGPPGRAVSAWRTVESRWRP